MIPSSARRTVLLVLASALATSAVAGCSSSSKSSNGGSNTTTTVNAAVLGTPKAATGTPLKIGFFSDGKSETIDDSVETPAAQATAKWVNEYLGGVAGHPITLDVCIGHNQPSETQSCVTQFINDKVPVVLNAVTGQPQPLVQGLAKANIPVVMYSAADQTTLTNPDAFVLTNGLALALTGAVVLGQQAGLKKAAIITIDVPAATGPIEAVGPTFFKNGGMTLQIVKVPPGTADMTPQVQTAVSGGAQLIYAIGDAAFCQSAVQGMDTTNFTGTRGLIEYCDPNTMAKSVNVSGATMIATHSQNPSDPEVQLYNAVMQKYGNGIQLNSNAEAAYGAVLGFARAMAAAKGDVTPQSVLKTISSMAPAQAPVNPNGVTFQCGAKIIPLVQAICTGSILTTTLDKNGKGGTYTALDTLPVSKLG